MGNDAAGTNGRTAEAKACLVPAAAFGPSPTIESFVALPVERTMVPRLDRIPEAPEPGLRRFDLRESNDPVTLPVSADGPSAPRSPKRQQYHYATWAEAPVVAQPQHLFHSDLVTFVGHSTMFHGADAAAPFTFPRNSRPGRGLSVTWDKGSPRRGKLDQAISVPDRIEGPMLCFGAMPDHFGHFLLEAVPRFWAIAWARARGLPIVVLHGPELRDWQGELLRLAGIDPAELTYVDTPTALTDAFVPGPLYRLHQNYHPRFKDTLRAMTARLAPSGDEGNRLFLGRGALRRGARLRNEEEVAAVYRDFGYRIMSPEQHSLTDQISAAAAARHIAGPIGSQLYLALFQREAASMHVFASPDFAFADDALIAAMNGGTCRFVFPETVTKGSVPRWDTFEIDPARVRAMLQALHAA